MFDLKTRILIADDMMTMRKMVAKLMKDIGFTDLVEVSDGKKAFEALESSPTPVGLIISDWNMPNCTGIEFLKKVRGDARFTKVPFILVTAEAEPHQIKEAIAAGVSNYVIKPFTADSIREKIEAVHKKVSASLA